LVGSLDLGEVTKGRKKLLLVALIKDEVEGYGAEDLP
jgi:hypothetical protein